MSKLIRQQERRFLPTQQVMVDVRADGRKVIAGYAAVFYDGTEATEYELWPGLRERVAPTAFNNAIAQNADVLGLFNHNSSLVLGRTKPGTMRLSVDSKGLRYEIDPGETTVAKDLMVNLERKEVTGSSFGFIADEVKWTRGKDFDIRELISVQLFDVGPVTFPAYAGTDAGVRGGAVRAIDSEQVREAWEKWRGGDAAPSVERDARNRRARLVEIGAAD